MLSKQRSKALQCLAAGADISPSWGHDHYALPSAGVAAEDIREYVDITAVSAGAGLGDPLEPFLEPHVEQADNTVIADPYESSATAHGAEDIPASYITHSIILQDSS